MSRANMEGPNVFGGEAAEQGLSVSGRVRSIVPVLRLVLRSSIWLIVYASLLNLA